MCSVDETEFTSSLLLDRIVSEMSLYKKFHELCYLACSTLSVRSEYVFPALVVLGCLYVTKSGLN